MGDCRLRILVDKDLIILEEEESLSSSSPWYTVTRTYSADTTVQEVMEDVLFPLKWKKQDADDNDAHSTVTGSFPLQDVHLWDCTLHPPVNITDWPLDLFNEKVGPKSRTLYDAGWYPSGTLQVLSSSVAAPTTASQQAYDDAQYNKTAQIQVAGSGEVAASSSSSVPRVQLVNETNNENNTQGPIMMMPSQVLQSVTTRFEGEQDTTSSSEAAARRVRRQHVLEKQQKQAERNRKLEERIRKLDSSPNNRKKNHKTSQQVQRMLIKSRCTGNKYLDMKDRVYLHCVVIAGVDDSTTEDYRYFSQQDTVAKVIASLKVLSSFSEQLKAELLVRTGQDEYRRLPTIMRLYEAMSQQYLQPVDSIVIRCYSRDEEEPTTSVLEDALLTMESAMEETTTADPIEIAASSASVASTSAVSAGENDTGDAEKQLVVDYAQLQEALVAMDDDASSKNKNSKKKSSTTSAKVRNMLIKSKAKGDTKRIPKMEDRFFMELVVVFHDKNGECTSPPDLSYVFMAKTDPIDRLLRDCVSYNDKEWPLAQVLVPTECGGSFHVVSQDLTWQKAQDKGALKLFDRVVVRLYN